MPGKWLGLTDQESQEDCFSREVHPRLLTGVSEEAGFLT